MSKGVIIRTGLSFWKGEDWCEQNRCPCLTCELWNHGSVEPECACKPCNQKGLDAPENVICWKTDENIRAYDKKSRKKLPSRKETEKIHPKE